MNVASEFVWLQRGVSEIRGAAALHRLILADIAEAVHDLAGERAGAVIATAGVEQLHEVLSADRIGAVRDHVLDLRRDELLRLAVTVGREVMNWTDDFFVDDYLILRINLPYEVAREAPPHAENPGIGRLSQSVRALAASRRVKDPRYDPKGYHRNHPPAAWAHGPHIDSWTGHSTGGLNIWWAMGEVPAEAGMVLYPELAGAALPCDPRSLYLHSGYRLPKPTFVPLQSGEMLIFDPEILHGTHLNVTGHTRVAISMRLNARKPLFDPGCFYAREFWRCATDIENGRMQNVIHLKREDHLAPAAQAPPTAPDAPAAIALSKHWQPPAPVASVAALDEDGRLVVEVDGHRILLVRRGADIAALDAAWPHYGLDLADGGEDGERLYCPGCGVGFDLHTGRSATPALALRTYCAREADGQILLEAEPRTAGSAE